MCNPRVVESSDAETADIETNCIVIYSMECFFSVIVVVIGINCAILFSE